MGFLLWRFLVGGAAGLFAWAVMEPSAPRNLAGEAFASWELTFILLLGAVTGLAIGALDGFGRGSRRAGMMGAGLGLVLGAIGATMGHGIGGWIASSIFGSAVFTAGNPMTQFLARIVAFVPLGACLGAGIGASSLNPKKLVQGLVGGLIAGAVAGALFDPIGWVVGQALLAARGVSSGEVGTASRALTALLIGAMVGLFIGIVDRVTRSAWLRLSLGRNEGREWSIDSAQTFIGRSEGAQVPLFGDPNVAPIHASIQRHGRDYVLVDGGSPVGTYLNGQRISQAPLFHGANIQIGGFALQFLMKNAAAPYRGPEAYPGQAYPMGTVAPHLYGQVPAPQPVQAQATGYPTQSIPAPASAPTMAYGAPLQPAAARASLVAMDGPLMGQRFPVASAVEVGRECPAVPMGFDTAASRRHATLSPAPHGVTVADLGSKNGTYVNGQRVSQATASPGDTIKIGSTTFRVEAS